MSWILLEYRCEACMTVHESLEPRGQESEWIPCCEGRAYRCISAPRVHLPLITAVTQGAPEQPPPGAYSTRSIAEGESFGSWKARRKAERAAARRRQIKAEA